MLDSFTFYPMADPTVLELDEHMLWRDLSVSFMFPFLSLASESWMRDCFINSEMTCHWSLSSDYSKNWDSNPICKPPSLEEARFRG